MQYGVEIDTQPAPAGEYGKRTAYFTVCHGLSSSCQAAEKNFRLYENLYSCFD